MVNANTHTFLPAATALQVLFLVFVSCQAAIASPAATTGKRPNFVLIFCDDLGFGDLRSYGHPYAETPHLDRLAQEGTIFRQFHVNGNICPVTRAGLMTGRNPSWFPNDTEDYGFLGALTVTKLLQQGANYTTGHIGKWNIGPNATQDAVEYGIDDLRITGSIPNDPRGREGLRFDETLRFLEDHQSESFYLNLWIYATHSPIDPPQSLIDHFQNLTIDRSKFGYFMNQKLDEVESKGGDINHFMGIYLAEVYALDIQVGRLLDKLDELGLSDDTVVVFSSDNGPERLRRGSQYLGYAGGLRGGKHTFFEGGTRVPFIVRWPGHVPAGRVDDTSIMFGLDWLPTVGTLAGAAIPWDLVEGEDLSDVWLGATRSRTDPLFFRVRQNRRFSYMRYGRWKLHVKEAELYDLYADPEERGNVYGTSPHIVLDMWRSLSSWESGMATNFTKLPGKPLPFDPTSPVQDIVLPNRDWAFSSPPVEPSTSIPSFEPSEETVAPSPSFSTLLPATQLLSVEPSEESAAPSSSVSPEFPTRPTLLPSLEPSKETVAPSPPGSTLFPTRPTLLPSLEPSESRENGSEVSVSSEDSTTALVVTPQPSSLSTTFQTETPSPELQNQSLPTSESLDDTTNTLESNASACSLSFLLKFLAVAIITLRI